MCVVGVCVCVCVSCCVCVCVCVCVRRDVFVTERIARIQQVCVCACVCVCVCVCVCLCGRRDVFVTELTHAHTPRLMTNLGPFITTQYKTSAKVITPTT